MPQQPDQPDKLRRKPLVTVEWQREVDVFTRETENRVFVKMYFDARDSGLLAAMPERLWKLLCLLATYMDENGLCYPSQTTIARDLGISRITANRWVQELLKFEFQGQHVASLVHLDQPRQLHGRWMHNVYQLYPITGLRIFDRERPGKPTDEKAGKAGSPTVYQKRYTEYQSTDTVNRYTNKNHSLNKKNVNVRVSTKEDPEEEQRAELKAQSIALAILDVCKDEHSIGSYLEIARSYHEGLIFEALSLTKDARARGRIRKSAGAYFTDTVARLAASRGFRSTDRPRSGAL